LIPLAEKMFVIPATVYPSISRPTSPMTTYELCNNSTASRENQNNLIQIKFTQKANTSRLIHQTFSLSLSLSACTYMGE